MKFKQLSHKKLIILIILTLLLSFSIHVFAADETTNAVFTVGSVEAQAGAIDVTIPISIVDCPSFTGLGLKVTYDTSVLTLTDISLASGILGFLEPNISGGIWNFDWPENAFDDGEIFVLKFSINPDALAGDYPINLALSNAGWASERVNPEYSENPTTNIITTADNFVAGKISVTSNSVAEYNDTQYETVNEAINAVANSGAPGTVTMLRDTKISEFENRIVIPTGANITLDMNGKTITSEVPYDHSADKSMIVEVRGELNIVDGSQAKGGKFIAADVGGSFTKAAIGNNGKLSVSDIGIYGFGNGLEGATHSAYNDIVQWGNIENCVIETTSSTISGRGTVPLVKGCILRGTNGVALSPQNYLYFTLIEDCLIDGEIEVRTNGTIETLLDCTVNNKIYLMVSTSSIGTIKDCTTKGITSYGGTIDKITSTSEDKHTTINGRINLEGGTINIIESDYTLFNGGTTNCINVGTYEEYDDGYVYKEIGHIGSILGGIFNSNRLGIYVNIESSIGTISGGNFNSGKYAAVETAGTIDSITGGTFVGGTDSNAIYVDGGSIAYVTGGLYKSLGGYNAFNSLDNLIFGDGYGLSTVVDESSFYKVDQTFDITWMVEGATVDSNAIVKGDPVEFTGDTPSKEAQDDKVYIFAGWTDGANEYGPGDTLPLASANITYTALFNEMGEGEDYTVSLNTSANNVNARESFALNVNIDSNSNNSFYGATIEVNYDNSKVELDRENSSLPAGFNISNNIDISGDISTLTIIGASSDGFEMTEHHYNLAMFSFKAKADLSSGQAIFSIGDNPIVNRQYDVDDPYVSKGEDIHVDIWNLTVTFKAGENVTLEEKTAYVKYNEAGLYTDNSYMTEFVEPVAIPASNYTLDEPLWKPENGENVDYSEIATTLFINNAVYTATASESTFAIDFPNWVEVVSGITADNKAIYNTDIKFKLNLDSGYQVKDVTYTVADGTPIKLTPGVEGIYTIAGENITGPIGVQVSQVISGSITFISYDDFKALPSGHKVLLFTANEKLASEAYEYNGNRMFYSSKYSGEDGHVYLYIVENGVTEESALSAIQINTDSETCIELKYDGDVNLNGRVNSTDAVLTHALYQGLWATDTTNEVSMQKRLEADVNGDMVVDMLDATMIQNIYWGIQ